MGGCRIIQPDLTHGSGITEVKRIASFADTYFVQVAPHNSAGPIGTLAGLQLGKPPVTIGLVAGIAVLAGAMEVYTCLRRGEAGRIPCRTGRSFASLAAWR